MDWWVFIKEGIQVAFVPLMLLIIYFHQKSKIKNLESQLKGQDKILESVKTLFEIFDLDMYKERIELYEKILEKEMKIKVNIIETKLREELKKMESNLTMAEKWFRDFSKAFTTALLYVPQNKRAEIVNEMKVNLLRDAYKNILPALKEFDQTRVEATLVKPDAVAKLMKAKAIQALGK